MNAHPGWYDAGVAGVERWWDGRQWTVHERPLAGAMTGLVAGMGWYPVPGTSDVRWWDGVTWTPYRIHDGRPKPDAFAVEPSGRGLVFGFVFAAIGLAQLFLFFLSRSGVNAAVPILFLLVAAIWLIGAVSTARVAKLPAPQTGPILDPSLQPLPGTTEGPGAGWYAVAGRITRWWTGTRWSWYVAQSVGVRPGHAGPRGYLVSLIVGWVLIGLAAAVVLAGIIGIAVGGVVAVLGGVGIFIGLLFAGLGLFVVLLTRARRFAFILPTQPPPLLQPR
ncbi:hypothetical protein GCM10025768_01650 [Microbacterium pseudoresistens]|uniref:Na+-transporting methylmalonyl-CoA/oxaloacetate decarboxylase gamma subunit n=1 Tax=Microbacterium pseudoresistens TaxID=640634 RepID=A0A7Y9EU50_9MICO|nr:DUF2510 domain-containing protein [Microbacterium pseudoresistens]NYD54000.1 Na+-transporting methylmalonyl-CoA/oxaloacetate decarboxylase gamma subunit [Microbacterium pseudoresistens]